MSPADGAVAALLSRLGSRAAGAGLGPVVLQGRGVGVLEALRSLPEPALVVFAALTTLGDTAVLLALAVLAYLLDDRRDGAFVVGTLFAGFAVVVALKTWFALPRPPADLRFVAAYGYGFPSGHALGATVGWGALAVAMDRRWTRRSRAAVAGTVAGTVALSRVVIGVHYLVDVVAGVAVGLVVLGVATRWGRDRPLRLFALAGALSLAAVAVTGADPEAAALLGATAGAATAWQVVAPADRPWGRAGLVASAGAGGLLLAGVAAADATAGVAFAAGALASVAVFLAPTAASRWLGAGPTMRVPGG